MPTSSGTDPVNAGRKATRVRICKSLVRLSQGKAGLIPRSHALEADTLPPDHRGGREAGGMLFVGCLTSLLQATLCRSVSLDCLERLIFLLCLTFQQHTSVSQGRICTDRCTCSHTEIKPADQTYYLTQSHYTDTGPTSPNADPTMPGVWQSSH